RRHPFLRSDPYFHMLDIIALLFALGTGQVCCSGQFRRSEHICITTTGNPLTLSSLSDIGGALYGPWMRIAILSSITISQIGFVAAYTIFVSQNLQVNS